MLRITLLGVVWLVVLALTAPEALAQAGGGSSGFGGGGGGGSSYGGGSSGAHRSPGFGWIAFGLFIVLLVLVVPAMKKRRRERARAERDARVRIVSAEAAQDDPAFAADSVKLQAAALYRDIQRAWSERDEVALQRMLGADLLVEWRRRLIDFASKGWVNEVAIRRGPDVEYVGLVNRTDEADDRVTVAISATLCSVVRTTGGAVINRNVDGDGDGEIEVCEYWTLARTGGAWRLVSIEQEEEGAHNLDAPIVAAPWSDDARLSDESLVGLATADAPPPGTRVSDLVSVQFDGTAREKALDLALADPRCSPDVLEAAARRAVDAWADAIDGDDSDLLQIATPRAAHSLLYPAGETQSRARVVVRGPQLMRLAITAVHTATEPPRMDVEAQLHGWRYIEDRDTAALLSGSKEVETEFTEHWTFTLDGPATTPWRLTASHPTMTD